MGLLIVPPVMVCFIKIRLWWLLVVEIPVSYTHLTNAKKSGLEVDTVILSPMSHAGYYPGGKVMTMKVVFEKETYRLLGAQIIGYEGVDKRIDVLATAIHAGLNATQLKDLDLAYADVYKRQPQRI